MQILPFRVLRSWRVLGAGFAYPDDVEGRSDLTVISAAAEHQVQQEPRLERVEETRR